MGIIRSYRDLIVWQKSIDLVTETYKLTQKFPKHELYGLTSQLRRSAVSVPSNIAEGQARQHTGEFHQFLHVALGSLAETHTQLIIARKLNYISDPEILELEQYITEIQKCYINSFLASLPPNH